MTTCCPNCPATALGTDAASICTECATATVAGASFDLTSLAIGLAAATIAALACRLFGESLVAWAKPKPAALA